MPTNDYEMRSRRTGQEFIAIATTVTMGFCITGKCINDGNPNPLCYLILFLPSLCYGAIRLSEKCDQHCKEAAEKRQREQLKQEEEREQSKEQALRKRSIERGKQKNRVAIILADYRAMKEMEEKEKPVDYTDTMDALFGNQEYSAKDCATNGDVVLDITGDGEAAVVNGGSLCCFGRPKKKRSAGAKPPAIASFV